ncbi:MAG: hypothetical protein R3C40_06490 [Parvularculaceae bacterium]
MNTAPISASRFDGDAGPRADLRRERANCRRRPDSRVDRRLAPHGRGELKGGGVVATVMSNLGLEKHLAGKGLALERTKVGDRYVVEAMRAKGMNVGGEPSGHVILSDHSTTGDGLVTALQVLAVVAEEGVDVSAACHVFDPYPQLLKNVRYNGGDPLAAAAVKSAISAGEARLNDHGRLVIRKSGHRTFDPGDGGRRRRKSRPARSSTISARRSPSPRVNRARPIADRRTNGPFADDARVTIHSRNNKTSARW